MHVLSGSVFHPPGTRTRTGVLDVGLRCAHACVFCYYRRVDAAAAPFQDLRRGGWRAGEACRRQLSLMAGHGLTQIDVTGGEPTLHPELPDIVRHAREACRLRVRVITLGQYLLRRRTGDRALLLDRLLEAGLTSFLFSMHAVDEGHFRQFTGGSWARLAAVLDRLDRDGFQYTLNTVVFSGNAHLLPEIARVAAGHGVYAHNFILFNPRHQWAANRETAAMLPDPAVTGPFLRQAVETLTRAGAAVTIRYAPLCVFPGLQRHVVGAVGVQFDPHEWANRAGNYDRSPEYCAEPVPLAPPGLLPVAELTRLADRPDGLVAWRGGGRTVFPRRCADCTALEACDGLSPFALERWGEAGLTPFHGPVTRGVLLAERLDYRPAFYLKDAAAADMRGLMLREAARNGAA